MDIYLNNNYQNSYIPFIQFAITGLMLLIGLMNQKKDWACDCISWVKYQCF